MNAKRFNRSVRVGVGVLLLLASPLMHAADDIPAKPTIEFRDFPGKPEDNVTYKFSLIVEAEGTDKKIELKDNTGTGGFSAPALVNLLEAEIKQLPGWKYSAMGSKLVIEGWTDPKTGKFYPVKKIRFESPNLPKEALPTVTLPGKKG